MLYEKKLEEAFMLNLVRSSLGARHLVRCSISLVQVSGRQLNTSV